MGSRPRTLIAATAALLLTLTAAGADDDRRSGRQAEIDASAAATLDRLFATQSSARELFDGSAGHAVFSGTRAGGFFVTGGGGTGVAVDKASGERTYMRMGSGGVGFGIGAQRYDLVIIFETRAHVQRFTEGGWDASATAQAAAGREGVAVTSSFVDGVAMFQLTARGLMALADVSGTRFWVAGNLN
jgi:lipid-binding SYLF domain-containing protein